MDQSFAGISGKSGERDVRCCAFEWSTGGEKNFSFEEEEDIDERHPIALSVAYKVIVVVVDIITSSSSSWTTTRRT